MRALPAVVMAVRLIAVSMADEMRDARAQAAEGVESVLGICDDDFSTRDIKRFHRPRLDVASLGYREIIDH